MTGLLSMGGNSPSFIELTTSIVSAYVSNNPIPMADLPALIAQGVVSLDMETAAIGECCEKRNVPWSVFRTISDRASDGSVDE